MPSVKDDKLLAAEVPSGASAQEVAPAEAGSRRTLTRTPPRIWPPMTMSLNCSSYAASARSTTLGEVGIDAAAT